jgi:hypothetical protein
MTKSDFNIFVLGLVLIAVAIASYAAKVSEVLRAVKTPSHFERYSYTTNITPDLNPRIRQPKMLIVLRENRRSYSYCKDTTCNHLP